MRRQPKNNDPISWPFNQQECVGLAIIDYIVRAGLVVCDDNGHVAWRANAFEQLGALVEELVTDVLTKYGIKK